MNGIKLKLSLLSMICACAVSVAQNARIDGLGGLGIFEDISHILYYPGGVNDYPDHVTGTVASYTDTAGDNVEYFGPFIATKSVGRTFTIGILANTVYESGSSILSSNFYYDAKSFLIRQSDEYLPSSFPMIPHLLLGLDFDVLSFGMEFFIEAARFKKKINIDTVSILREKAVYNVGGKLSTCLFLDPVWILPIIGIGSPYIKGIEKDTATNRFSSKNALYLSAGGEVGAELPAVTVVGGLFFTKENYVFKDNHHETPATTTRSMDLYLGFSTELAKDMLFGMEYDFSRWYEEVLDTNKTDGTDYKNYYTCHDIHAGVEKRVILEKVFDCIIPRAGLAYYIENYKERSENSGSEDNDTTTNFAAYAYDAEISAGIGIRKGIFGIDIFVNIGNWSGVFTGPRAASITLTLGKK